MDKDEDYEDDEYDLDDGIETVIRDEFDLEDDRERMRKALLSSTDRTMATFCIASPTELTINIDAPCHANLTHNLTPDTHLFASCFETRVTEKAKRKTDSSLTWDSRYLESNVDEPIREVAERYWDFMTGDRSPWKLLFKNHYPEAIRSNEGEIAGFFLDPKMAVKYPGLTLNYCIAMRMIGEERETMRVWSRLIDEGMPEADALYLVRMVKKSTNLNHPTLFEFNRSNDTCHWPLSAYCHSWRQEDSVSKAWDFHRFREGNPLLSITGSELLHWCTEKEREDFSFALVKGEVLDRSGNGYFELEKIISAFYDWQIKHNQHYSQANEQERKVA